MRWKRAYTTEQLGLPWRVREDDPSWLMMQSMLVGQQIMSIDLARDNPSTLPLVLVIAFMDGMVLRVWDRDQTCCEERYMTAESDMSSDVVGAVFLGIDILDVPSPDRYNEVQFLHVRTDRSVFVFSTHNIHNGCYEGFDVVATLT